MTRSCLAAAVALAALAVAAPATAQDRQTITQIVRDDDRLAAFSASIEVADMARTLAGGAPFTLFAPENAAFEATGSSLEPTRVESLRRTVSRHMVFGTLSAADLSDGMVLETLHGSTLPVTVADGVATVGGAEVTRADIEAANGMIHIVDTVLVPGDALPLTDTSGATIAALVRAAPALRPLFASIAVAGLEPTLDGEGPFTVFAPAEVAYTKLGQGKLEPTRIDFVRNVILYHAVSGSLALADLKDGDELTSVQGATLKITRADGAVMVNGATLIRPDVAAANGTVHVIDAVLFPPEE